MIKICDFGWAVNCADGMRETRCGTPLYLSPEMIRGEQYDESVDIWAVGVLTYELLVGSMPFKIWWEGELDKIVIDNSNIGQ
jgi:aurora kinase